MVRGWCLFHTSHERLLFQHITYRILFNKHQHELGARNQITYDAPLMEEHLQKSVVSPSDAVNVTVSRFVSPRREDADTTLSSKLNGVPKALLTWAEMSVNIGTALRPRGTVFFVNHRLIVAPPKG